MTTDPGSGAAPVTGAAPEAWVPSETELARRALRKRMDRRRILVATVSTVVVFGVLIAVLVTSPGWKVFQETFFDLEYAREVFPGILEGFKTDLLIVVFSTVIIAVLAMVIAIARTTRAAATAPVRFLATGYVDLFRGIPLLLVLYLIGFGLPALQISWLPTSPVVLGTVAISLTYAAYVAEVIRSGILSVHPSQRAAARALGLSQGQTMRHVVLPQALRRVVPPLLNDFVSLLKDVSLVSVLGVYEGVRQAQIYTSESFNFTPFVVAAAIFLVVTIPLTRVTDRVLARAIARQNAQGTA
ncbi:MAG: amino acid ABC transporter permease [Candidatus Nanopelagicales bacterium]